MARIVIAEDQAHIRHILMMWLGRHGHEVIEAPNGLDALEALRTRPVDLLITDINMPEMDGIALAKCAFDQCVTLQHVFVVTSRCDQHDIIAQIESPRVTVIPKPFSPSQLLKDVERVAKTIAPTGPALIAKG
jgi:DNA-binding response OmpR family regulator